jgi:hypothetical protein
MVEWRVRVHIVVVTHRVAPTEVANARGDERLVV